MSAIMMTMTGEVIGQPSSQKGLRRKLSSRNSMKSLLESSTDNMISRSSGNLELSSKCLDMLMNDLVVPKTTKKGNDASNKKEPSTGKKRGWGRRRKKDSEPYNTLDIDTKSTDEDFDIEDDGMYAAAGEEASIPKKPSYLSLSKFASKSPRTGKSSVLGKFFKTDSETTKNSRSDGDLRGLLRMSSKLSSKAHTLFVSEYDETDGMITQYGGTGRTISSFKKSRSVSRLELSSNGINEDSHHQQPTSLSPLQNESTQLLISESRRHILAAGVSTTSHLNVVPQDGDDRDEATLPSKIAARPSPPLLSRRDKLNAARGGWSSNRELGTSSTSRRSGNPSSRRREELLKSQTRSRSSRDLLGERETVVVGGGALRYHRSSSSSKLLDLERSSDELQPRLAPTKVSSASSSSPLGGEGNTTTLRRYPRSSSSRRILDSMSSYNHQPKTSLTKASSSPKLREMYGNGGGDCKGPKEVHSSSAPPGGEGTANATFRRYSRSTSSSRLLESMSSSDHQPKSSLKKSLSSTKRSSTTRDDSRRSAEVRLSSSLSSLDTHFLNVSSAGGKAARRGHTSATSRYQSRRPRRTSTSPERSSLARSRRGSSASRSMGSLLVLSEDLNSSSTSILTSGSTTSTTRSNRRYRRRLSFDNKRSNSKNDGRRTRKSRSPSLGKGGEHTTTANTTTTTTATSTTSRSSSNSRRQKESSSSRSLRKQLKTTTT